MKKFLILLFIFSLFFGCNSDDDTYTAIEVPNVIAEFKPNLSELNLFTGNLSDLNPSSKTFEYKLHSALFSDYAHKQRLIALPNGTSLTYNGDGLPIFPDNTVIAKTFYYHNNETDLSQGKTIIETRLLIKLDGNWEAGNYKWNEDQSEAVLDYDGSIVPITWIDQTGAQTSINYQIPSNSQCFTCHQNNDIINPIGPKLRTLNFELNGENQLQTLINNNFLQGLDNPSLVNQLPKWDDSINYSLEERARAYFDINCAHCHTDGGICDSPSILRLSFETNLEDSNIIARKNSIINRMASDFQVGITMPWIGTTIHHDEGINLILSYLDTL